MWSANDLKSMFEFAGNSRPPRALAARLRNLSDSAGLLTIRSSPRTTSSFGPTSLFRASTSMARPRSQ